MSPLNWFSALVIGFVIGVPLIAGLVNGSPAALAAASTIAVLGLIGIIATLSERRS